MYNDFWYNNLINLTPQLYTIKICYIHLLFMII